jgi:hypothetical protein
MKQFCITGDFSAENIDDAFRLLALYFECLRDGIDSDVFEGLYTFDIYEAHGSKK